MVFPEEERLPLSRLQSCCGHPWGPGCWGDWAVPGARPKNRCGRWKKNL